MNEEQFNEFNEELIKILKKLDVSEGDLFGYCMWFIMAIMKRKGSTNAELCELDKKIREICEVKDK